jgi:K+/H+ antiporter YhaU regulatory subunit KhtT
MSLAAQIAEMEDEMEDELEDALRRCHRYEATIQKLKSGIEDLESDNWELADSIEFIDKTNPELRVAYDAAKALEKR